MAIDKLVDSTQLDADLTSVANAIRSKGGTSAQLAFPAEFVQAIGDIETGGGGDYVANDWLDKNKPVGEVSSNISGSLGYFTFFNRDGITKLNIPNVTLVQRSFCQSCGALEEVIAPELETINPYAFAETAAMNKPLYVPKAVISNNAFEASTVPIIVYYRCANANSKVFLNNKGLTAVDQLSGYALNGGEVFKGCTALKTVILRATSVVAMSGIGIFASTPFANGQSGGTLYVPSALIDNYQAATGWSTILGYPNNQILPIEGSIYETQYADGTACETRYINYALTNCVSSSMAKSTTSGNAFSTTITANDGYTLDSVSVVMGGVDVTSTVYEPSTGEISIAAVDGSIFITATAA